VAWIYLFIAGILEIVWAVSLKYTVGYTRLWPTVGNFIVMFLGVGFLSKAVVTLPVGTAYAVWTGMGVIGTTALGIILFKEPREWFRLVFVLLVLSGIIGLKLTTPK